ncbi:MAG: type II secretion system F family protein [Candidatus Dojkabacteria bacterium]|nr:type II secretion system F family protein [Candidatus Dojkabacteria bacterium]
MKKYKYSARDNAGKIVEGDLEAKDSSSVADILHDRGLIVVSIRESFAFNLERLSEINIGGVPMKDKVVFMRQMSTMVGAGLPLTRALEIMVQQASNPLFKRVLEDVLSGVQSGKTLANSFREKEEIFDEISLNLIEAGEESGNLDSILEKLASELEDKKGLSDKLRSAMIYPAIILVIIIAVIVLMMFVLVPSMATIYGDFNAELPWATRFLMDLSQFFIKYWWAILVVLAVLVIGIKAFLDSKKGRRIFDKIVLKIPGVGAIVSKMQLAQFTRILALLLGSGLSIMKALELTALSLSNEMFRDTILSAKEEVEKGGALAIPIARSEYFPLIVSSMIAVGEETGEMDTVLNKVSEYYKDEVNVATSNLSSILEPVFLVIMGLAIGFIALAVYMPMFQLSSAIG